MEDHRDDLIVILAGYSKEMAEFLTANSGLKSRFPNIIEFPRLYRRRAAGHCKAAGGRQRGIRWTSAATQICWPISTPCSSPARGTQATGGWPATKWEEAILNQSRRLVAQPEADLCLLLPEDFQLDDVGGV